MGTPENIPGGKAFNALLFLNRRAVVNHRRNSAPWFYADVARSRLCPEKQIAAARKFNRYFPAGLAVPECSRAGLNILENKRVNRKILLIKRQNTRVFEYRQG